MSFLQHIAFRLFGKPSHVKKHEWSEILDEYGELVAIVNGFKAFPIGSVESIETLFRERFVEEMKSRYADVPSIEGYVENVEQLIDQIGQKELISVLQKLVVAKYTTTKALAAIGHY